MFWATEFLSWDEPIIILIFFFKNILEKVFVLSIVFIDVITFKSTFQFL